MGKDNKSEQPCPEDNANILSRILFWWLNPLLRLGYKRSLEEADLFAVSKKDSSTHLSEELEKNWELELQKLHSGKQPSLCRVICKTFGARYLAWGVIVILLEALRILQPILLGNLILFFSPDAGIEVWEGYLYAMGVSLCSIVPAVCFHVYTLAMCRFGMQMRIAVCSLVYKKCLRLSSAALGQTSVGQIVNLMSNDAQKLDSCVLVGHYLVLGPLELIVVGVILWYKIYYAVLAGLTVLVLMIPISGILGKVFGRLRGRIAVHTDERVRLTNEMLNAMRVVKMYCWEKLFKGLINTTRVQEMASVMKASVVRAMAMAPFFYAPKLIAYFTFLTFVLSGNRLTAEVVFVTLSLYTPVRLAMTWFLPIGAQMGSEALVTLRRMQDFLLKEERAVTLRALDGAAAKEQAIAVSSATASWEENSDYTILRNLNFDVKPGELLIVIGSVGAGKSSLLMAILGELPLRKGEIGLSGKLAYVSQQAWVFGASVRDNILFGEPYDPEKYKRIVEAAALKRDFELMSEGDQTLVGDRGVGLSGGQKARISLARALYQDAEVYLLDDPLSAVDAHVSNHLFHKCICGYLKNKTRILVTHQLQYLKEADKILVLSSSNHVQLGTLEELTRGGVDVVSLLKQDGDVASKQSQHTSNGETPVHTNGIVELSNGGKLKGDRGIMGSDPLTRDDLILPTKAKQSKLTFLSKSYADVRNLSLRDLRGAEPLLSQSVDLKKALDKTQRAGTLASLVSVMTLPIQEELEEYVPQAQQEESRAAGTVSGKLYLRLFYTGGGVFGLILYIFLNLIAQISFVLADWWLAYWCTSIELYERAQLRHLNMTDDANMNVTSASIENFSSFPINDTVTSLTLILFPHTLTYLHVFTGITAAVVLFGILRALHGFHIVVQASKTLHMRMLNAILRSPIGFFDRNPIGRILNRFSKDLGQTDEVLPFYMYDFIQCLLLILAVFIVVAVTNPWVIIAIVPLIIMFALLRRYFVCTVRSIKRLEATTKSPVFSHISSTLLGIHTIHSCRAEKTFVREFFHHQDLHTSAFFSFIALVRWFALRLETICALFITVVAFCAVFASQSMTGSLVGLSLNYAMTLMMLFQWGVRQSSEVESLMTSVERIVEYTELPSEAPLESTELNKPPETWPREGKISGRNVCLKYKEDGENVLKHLSFAIHSSEKIGIVGRTGAGKSSLISLLFRLVEPQGELCIDDIVITRLGLHDLRERVSIIPQDPVLLTGSVRKNLDPLNVHTDLEIWQVLKQVQLHKVFEEMSGRLESPIQEGGANLSMGQRQLLCLARAILKCNKILVIDEATANVDPQTDALIQQTIREQFAGCTVLTIAHRLNTIIDSDRIMVLDAGQLIEFDCPHNLLQQATSHFYKMAEQTGPNEFNFLRQAAKKAFEKKSNLAQHSSKIDLNQNGRA